MYHHGVEPVTAFVLAGGRSSRMGQEKAFLQLGGRTLLERALQVARAAAGNAWIVGSAARFGGFGPLVDDVYPGRGPLGGIHAALSRSSTDLNLVLAVDMPFLQVDFLQYLISVARDTPAVATVPQAEGGWQPLCAVYRSSFAANAGRSLQAGNNKIDALFGEVDVRIIDADEQTAHGFTQTIFRNLNTVRDWEEAKKNWGLCADAVAHATED